EEAYARALHVQDRLEEARAGPGSRLLLDGRQPVQLVVAELEDRVTAQHGDAVAARRPARAVRLELVDVREPYLHFEGAREGACLVHEAAARREVNIDLLQPHDVG